MSVPARGSEEITPPSSFHGPPLTPPPADEKEARDTSYILRQIAKHRSGNVGPKCLLLVRTGKALTD